MALSSGLIDLEIALPHECEDERRIELGAGGPEQLFYGVPRLPRGTILIPLAAQPEIVGKDLGEVADAMLRLDS